MRDNCKGCPMFWSSCDYWGECDEGCELNLEGWFDGKGYKIICYMPKPIKKIFQKYYRWKEDRRWEKIAREQTEYEEEI